MRRHTYGALCLTLVCCLSAGCGVPIGTLTAAATAVEILLDALKFTERTATQVASARSLKDHQTQEGPQIERRLPEETVFRSDRPVEVCLDFNPAVDGVEADMATLKVEVLTLKGWYGKDITDEIQRKMEDRSEDPAICLSVDLQGYIGSVQFLVSIKDQNGRLSEKLIEVTLKAAELVLEIQKFAELSPEEVARLRAPQPQEGPQIDLRVPEDKTTFRSDEPVEVHLNFNPAVDGVEANMASLKVKVRKGWLGRDITEAVKPYVEGTVIRVPSVDFQGYTGRFQFIVRIEDQKGRRSEERFEVTLLET